MNTNSLKIKIVGLVAVIVTTVVSVVSWNHYREQKTVLVAIAEKNATILIDSVLANIQTSMKGGHSTTINSILRDAKVHDQIRELRIIREDGTIIHSADKNDIGKELTDQERNKILSSKQNHFYFTNHENNLDSYTRILNTPECHSCHDPKKSVIALIETEISLNELTGYINKDKRNTIISSAVMILLILGAIFIFLTFYVDRPIRKLVKDMKNIEQGNFEIGETINSSHEMNILSQHLSAMSEKLKNLMHTTILNERELTRAEEKLSHHHETELLNQTLEDQLREIENLNVTLEERIEEVELANFTIADLAAELEQKNTHLEQSNIRLSTIYKVGLAINSTIDIDRLFNLIVRTTTSTLNAQIGYIILYDKPQQLLKVTNLIANGKLIAPQKVIPVKETSVSSWVITNNQPLLIADINQAPQFDRFSALGYERKTLICAPLAVRDEIIGTISVVNKTDNSRFDASELEMLNTIAAQAAIAIKNATLYDGQQQTYLNTIQALVTAIEASDSYTKGHSERVTRYSMEIGRRINLPADRQQILERASILHDIGKIGIDLHLLKKEGKLSVNDINLLQMHPAIGMKILEPIEFLSEVRTCIGQHHERYDGMGYPGRIKKTEQLLEARIIAVADTFDAMTSDRPYRKALSMELAISELQDNAGTQLDPEIVHVFTEILEEGLFFSSRFDTAQQATQAAYSS